MSHSPLVAITCNLDERDLRVRRDYAVAVERAGGVPILLPPPSGDEAAVREAVARYLSIADAFIFTGGDDPRTEHHGEPTHPSAKPMSPDRQHFEEALLKALDESRAKPKPVLGVCLGMQLMALNARGRLHQHLPDVVGTASDHLNNAQHVINPTAGASGGGGGGGRDAQPRAASVITAGTVTSAHHQAVADPGRLRVIAKSPDGVIEAIDDPARPFYLGVQWHPERTPDDALGPALFRALVAAARFAAKPL
ncbi:MAG TPA: type 1 glutamine amidotransferase [Phycisphaerales bacterium]|nr:type 1 glutamine amidotransferase [Phycisphaerales bacterium]